MSITPTKVWLGNYGKEGNIKHRANHFSRLEQSTVTENEEIKEFVPDEQLLALLKSYGIHL